AAEATPDELLQMMEDMRTIENWVTYLATPAAAAITGNIYVVSGRHIGLLGPWNEIASLDADGQPWSLDGLCEAVPNSALAESTLTPRCGATSCRSKYSVSLTATTACLAASYGPPRGVPPSPAIDEVFTM